MNSRPYRFAVALPCAIALITGLCFALAEQTTALERTSPRSGLSHPQKKPAQVKALTFADRVAYQRAIEEVYWRHRIWPKENTGAKPSLDQVMLQAQIEKKVENYLRDSAALEIYWHKPISPEQLQAEMQRMAQHTKQPDVLREVFAALGNNPTVIAECLARPALAERLARNWYAHDERFHGDVKRRAEGELAAHPTVDQIKHVSGEYAELEWIKSDGAGAGPATAVKTKLAHDDLRSIGSVRLGEAEWNEKVQKLSASFAGDPGTTSKLAKDIPDRKLSHLQEDELGYYATAVMSKSKDRLRLATVEWKKEPFDTWRSEVARHMPTPMVAPVTADYRLPAIAEAPSGCTDDTWNPTLAATQPDARQSHTAVWTGSEMIVWGGTDTPSDTTFKFFQSGGRYNPATDTWSAASNAGTAIRPRAYHTAVWTGTEMIVWGGESPSFTYLSDGGRYNPTTDSWKQTSPSNAPSQRALHTAVWTGSEMIVWGGFNGFGAFNTGARYNPNTDSWTATTSTGSPTARYVHTAIWTGSEMIVWGGFGTSSALSTGGRYDPSTDSWVSTSIAVAPAPRHSHTAVWTGTQMMIWGGYNSSALNTGGQYDPSSDSWIPMTTINAPSARYLHTAVWTGSEMIVWGGYNHVSDLNTGAKYNPNSDSWTSTSATNAPSARDSQTAVWTGSEMIVWGGGMYHSSSFDSGARYDPNTDAWTATSRIVAPTAHYGHIAVSTGSEMIVWGGTDGWIKLNTGGRYDPVTDSWILTSTANAPYPRTEHTAVWTGTEMIVWGGAIDQFGPYTNTGGRYNPTSDTWIATDTNSGYTPTVRANHTAVWTGSEMIVWGGIGTNGYVNNGGRYAPATDTWSGMTTSNAPTARAGHTAVWTDTEMIVWGGNTSLNTGGKYNPATDTWIATSVINAPAGRYNHSAIWTGCEMIVWGGYAINQTNTGGRYDPGADTWVATSTLSAPDGRESHTAIWTGSEMIIWGGIGLGGYRNNGGRYNPSSDSWLDISTSDAPDARSGHTAVWTGSRNQMIVWGGIGLDGYLNTGGAYCAFTGSPPPCSPTPTPSPSPTPTPTPTPTPAPVKVNLSVSQTQITEGQTSTYRVRASSAVAQDTTVPYTMSGTAASGSDYALNPAGGQVTILAGQSSAQVKLKAKTDGLTEGTETAIMTLQPGSGYRLGNPREATVSVQDP